MEGEQFVLTHKTIDALFIRCTRNRKGRGQWEYTEDFDLATKFADSVAADKAMQDHGVPVFSARLRPYENALADWHKAGAPSEPHKPIRKNAPTSSSQTRTASPTSAETGHTRQIGITFGDQHMDGKGGGTSTGEERGT